MTDPSLSKMPVRPQGVTDRIRLYFWKFPNASTPQCCRDLELNYQKYRNLCYRIKSDTKKLLEGKVEGRVLVGPLAHRVEWRTEVRLPGDVVNSLIFEGWRRRPRREDPKPVGEWYVIPNRNRQLQFVNEFVSVRVFPKSGTCRVLPRQPMDWDSIKIHVQNAFFKAGLDLRDCEAISEKLEPHTRHRIFRVGPVTPFKIEFYKKPLGITLGADGSHPEHIEVSEDWPTWIKPQLEAIARQTEVMLKLAEQINLHLGVMKGIEQAQGKLDVSIQNLTKAAERLTTILAPEKPKPFDLKEWLIDVSRRLKKE